MHLEQKRRRGKRMKVMAAANMAEVVTISDTELSPEDDDVDIVYIKKARKPERRRRVPTQPKSIIEVDLLDSPIAASASAPQTSALQQIPTASSPLQCDYKCAICLDSFNTVSKHNMKKDSTITIASSPTDQKDGKENSVDE